MAKWHSSWLDLARNWLTRGKKKPEQIVQFGDKPVIGLVVTTFDKGGLEQVVLNLYLGYKKRGYKVYMLVEQNILGLMAQSIEPEELIVFNDEATFLQTLRDKNITVVHYHYSTFACEQARQLGVHTIYTMHNVYVWKSDLQIIGYNKLLETMDKIIPVSNFVKNYYVGRLKCDDKKFQVIYNGVDFTDLDNTELPPELARSNFAAEDEVTLGFVASFYPQKGQIGMLGVMEKLLERNPKVKLLFIGNTNTDYYKDFIKKYEQSPVKDNLIVVPYFEHKYIGEFLRRNIDIFTLPTLQEGCSNAVLEAIYCDRPMVLTDIGNASDVKYLGTSIIVPPAYGDIQTTTNTDIVRIALQENQDNRDALVDAYTQMIAQYKDYEQKAKIDAKEKEKFSTDAMADQYVELIKGL